MLSDYFVVKLIIKSTKEIIKYKIKLKTETGSSIIYGKYFL
jgi:hypothetical protein